jgi:hypothetical protein
VVWRLRHHHRKPGYQAVRTNHRIDTPWCEPPGIDIFTECLMPFTDDRTLDTFVLQRAQPVEKQALLKSADEMKARALNSVQ